MPWQQLTLHLAAVHADLAAEVLEECGAISVTMQDAAGEIVIETQWDERPLWSKVRLAALLSPEADAGAVVHVLEQRLAPLDLRETIAFELARVEDQDWAHKWKENYKPIHMGGRLWICPSWCTPPEPDAVNIVLDPGMAFGTGDHPTTALCLEWLAGQNLDGKTVLDYGCGSGILAIAALKLGAREAWAVDIDEQALTVTRENAARNDVDRRLHVLPAQELASDLRADCLVANILARALVELAPTLLAHTRPGGELALSGLLLEQADMVLPHYAPPFTLKQYERQGWVALAGSRP